MKPIAISPAGLLALCDAETSTKGVIQGDRCTKKHLVGSGLARWRGEKARITGLGKGVLRGTVTFDLKGSSTHDFINSEARKLADWIKRHSSLPTKEPA